MKKNDMANILPLENKNFIKIVDFYLLNCIVEKIEKKKSVYERTKVNKRGISLSERGIKGYNVTRLRNLMITANSPINYKYEINISLLKESKDEYLYLKKIDNGINQTNKILYLIRNSLAHGEFTIKNNIYYFENYKNNELRGKAKLKESTLLLWIDLCNKTKKEIEKLNGK